ncbi:MAG: tRNA pseudouridine synthase [Fibrobacteres bacterium]|nr:tRNA pseudouridine synthase [Fibrobacterota bacterium]
MSEGLPGGVLLLDKPQGITSFQALRPVKRLFPKTKIGHAGTLDPAASGLLLIGIGAGTRLLEYLEGMPKTYSFIARFGLISDSYDMEGAVEPHPAAGLTEILNLTRIEKALEPFRGRIRQTPPVYSAIKIDGERACDRVRAGETVTLESREVVVHALRLISFSRYSRIPEGAGTQETGAYAEFEMTCSKGTYVRSLVHDLGLSLGCGAVTDKIRRLAIGPFRVEDAIAPEALVPGVVLLPLDSAVVHLPAAVVPADWVARFLNGQSVSLETDAATVADAPVEYRALDGNGRLLAIATLSPQGKLCPRKVLVKG